MCTWLFGRAKGSIKEKRAKRKEKKAALKAEKPQAEEGHEAGLFIHDEQAYTGDEPLTDNQKVLLGDSKHTLEDEQRIIGTMLCQLASGGNPVTRRPRKKGIPRHHGKSQLCRTWPVDEHDWVWKIPPQRHEMAEVEARMVRSDEDIIVPWDEFAEEHSY